MTSGEPTASWVSKTSALVMAGCTVVATVIGYFTLAAAVGWPPFGRDAVVPGGAGQVNVYKGGGCADGNNCAFIGVEIEGFAPDSEVICHYQSSVGGGGFTAQILQTDRDGRARQESSNRFWDPSGAGWVAVTCDDVRGVLQNW